MLLLLVFFCSSNNSVHRCPQKPRDEAKYFREKILQVLRVLAVFRGVLYDRYSRYVKYFEVWY